MPSVSGGIGFEGLRMLRLLLLRLLGVQLEPPKVTIENLTVDRGPLANMAAAHQYMRDSYGSMR